MALKTTIIGLKELRENTQKYISEIDKGKSFVVVRRSKPVFIITPPDDESLWETVAEFTAINKKGVSASTVLKKIKALA